MRNVGAEQWYALDRDKGVGWWCSPAATARAPPAARISSAAACATRAPSGPRAFASRRRLRAISAGLMALYGRKRTSSSPASSRGPPPARLVVRRRCRRARRANGELTAEAPLPAGTAGVELRLAIDEGTAAIDWRPSVAARGARSRAASTSRTWPRSTPACSPASVVGPQRGQR